MSERKQRPSRRRALPSPLSILLAALLVFAAAPAAHAVPIVTWDLANATGQDAAVLSTALNVSATGIDEVGVTEWASTAQDGFIASTGWAGGLVYDPTRYFEWTVTAAAGFEITYDMFDLALFRGVSGGQHGAELWDLRASTDGFASSDIALGTFDISASGVDEQVQFVGHDISALGTQTGTVTFRLHGYDQTLAVDYSGFGNDSGWLISGTGLDPVVHGTVATVPEPPPALLACLGLLGLLAGGTPRR